ncbi:recombination mediator RecR [Ferrimicrobium sp.]|uniref:recombination mediator RecR n=1 Tax=Ferrimicrobium sp. TaxID=2926050 RepID=UPI00263525FF|nr:recombination mediator RecR [Ferrimicrobium sp.]
MYPASLAKLMDELSRLPGIGPKSAQRIALFMVKRGPQDAQRLADALTDAVTNTKRCRECFALSEDELCGVCANPGRDRTVICVVEEPRDVLAFERGLSFRGLYHVLGGVISPMDGVGPEQLHLSELLNRLRDTSVKEVILATSSTIEGEATATYIAKLVSPAGVGVSRLATGVPVGGDLDYVDEVTLSRALDGRYRL